MFIRLAAAALSGALGAPNIITLSDTTSTGVKGRTAGVIVANTGAFYNYISNTPVVISNWISPLTNFDQFEVRATLSSGDSPTGGTLDTWQELSTSRNWTLSSIVVDETLSSTLLIEIRWTGNNVVQDSCTVTLNATGPSSGGEHPGGNGAPP